MKLIAPLMFAVLSTLAYAEEVQEQWVLILTPLDQPVAYIPGFTSKKLCVLAGNKWLAKQRASAATAVCAKQ